MRDYIDDRLAAWARWAISGMPKLGGSDRTPLFDMIKSGVTTKGYGLKPEPEAREEEETEAALQWLRIRQVEQYDVVTIHYAGRGTTKQKSTDLGMTESAYFKTLKLAKYRLEAWFEARAA